MSTELTIDHEVLITVAILDLDGQRATTPMIAEILKTTTPVIRRVVERLRDGGYLACKRGGTGGVRCTGKKYHIEIV